MYYFPNSWIPWRWLKHYKKRFTITLDRTWQRSASTSRTPTSPSTSQRRRSRRLPSSERSEESSDFFSDLVSFLPLKFVMFFASSIFGTNVYQSHIDPYSIFTWNLSLFLKLFNLKMLMKSRMIQVLTYNSCRTV